MSHAIPILRLLIITAIFLGDDEKRQILYSFHVVFLSLNYIISSYCSIVGESSITLLSLSFYSTIPVSPVIKQY